MAMEDAINRLACAVERNNESMAVAEIIRQRNAWQTAYEEAKRNHEYYERRFRDQQTECQRIARSNNSLRGVVTRMKKKAAGL